MTNETALITIEAVEAELLSDSQVLYYEGAKIGQTLEGELKTALLSFYTRALPFAEKVKEVRPWLTPEYSHLKDADPDRAFLKFLRSSFSNDIENMAYNQAIIVKMMLDHGWNADTIKGIGIKRLWRISNVIKDINTADRQSLLEAAREVPYREFDAYVKSLKHGYHIEPLKDKLITGPKSAMNQMDQYLDACKSLGDDRMQGEILADTVGGIMISDSEKEFKEVVKETEIIGLLCETMRCFHKEMKELSNTQIIAELCREMLHGFAESAELPEYLFKRYEKIIGLREEILTNDPEKP
jgi:hypothetical protein